KASRNIRVPWGILLLSLSLFARNLRCPHTKPITSRAFNHWLCCGEMMAGAMRATLARRNAAMRSASHPRLRARDDLHGDTSDPADQDQPGPEQVGLGAHDDDADREERGQRRAEGADRREELRRVDLRIIVAMEGKLRRIDAEIEADRADQHHHQQEAL